MLTNTPLPFGCRDIKLFPISDAGVVGAGVDLPYSRTLSFSEAEDFEELRGDDKKITERGSGPSCEWDLESGGISFEAWKVLSGGTIIESGVTPNQIKTFKKTGLQSRPFFKVIGQAISDSGGDVHVVIYRCRCTGNLEGSFNDQEFLLTSGDGVGFPDPNNAEALYDFIQHETATTIAV